MRVCALSLLLCCLACQGSPRRGVPEASVVASAAPHPARSAFPAAPASVAPPTLAIPTFADLAARANPAVVFIETEQAMFGRGRRIVSGGIGTGFLFDASGLVLTNHHVIASATRIEVVFGDEDRKRAVIVGTDPPTDIAVLRVEGRGFPSLPLGDSDAARVGDWVVAIGNPFSLSHTVSAGILSARGRTRSDVKGLDPTGYYDYLQTDASINPGNSGGPLIDLSGRVVGINTAIKPEANGIGFAIPINMVRELLPQLVESGSVRRSAMGVSVATLRDEDVKRLGVPKSAGALVTQVVRGGPGDQAGILVDDVITSFEGSPGLGPNRLRWLTSVAGVGKAVRVTVQRSGRRVPLTVTLGGLEAPQAAPPPVAP